MFGLTGWEKFRKYAMDILIKKGGLTVEDIRFLGDLIKLHKLKSKKQTLHLLERMKSYEPSLLHSSSVQFDSYYPELWKLIAEGRLAGPTTRAYAKMVFQRISAAVKDNLDEISF